VIAGNVATPEAVIDLENWGADATKVGVGPGKVCITKLKTGFGTGGWQLSALKWCARVATKPIIADGGIRSHGDIAKSIRFGATMVMIGSLFAGHEESPGKTVEVDGELFKEYYGSASDFNKGEYKHVEGKRILEPIKGKLADTLIEMEQDVQSSISYAGGTQADGHAQGELRDPGRRQRRRTPADVSVGLPGAGQQHGGQMSARRMPDNGDTCRVSAVLRDIAVGPCQRLHHLHRDLRDRHGRAQRVVRHHHAHALLCERRGNEGVIGLVQAAPVAAVNEHQHRRLRRRSREDVQGFAGSGAVGNIEHCAALSPTGRRFPAPTLKMLRVFRHQSTVVVHAVEPFGGVAGHEILLRKEADPDTLCVARHDVEQASETLGLQPRRDQKVVRIPAGVGG
jgi:IMP dehydrogenase/GMP reductase